MRAIFMALLATCLSIQVGGCAAGNQLQRTDAVTPRKPNIIIVLADDMGFGDIGVNGAVRIKTPNIDAIAADGVNFTQFYASANICTPSRAGLMTGRYPIRSGLGYNVITAQDSHGLPEAEETIGEVAGRAGYATMLIGKWHLGQFPDHAPMKHGFDKFYGVPHSNDMPNFALYRGEEKIEDPVNQSTLTQRYTDEAVKFIDAVDDQPFLLFVSHTMPHIPLYASDAFKGESEAGLYGDVIEELDASVGRIVEKLKATDRYNDTIIFITSDNGPFFEGRTAGLKGGKGSTWEGAYRVPLVVGWTNGDFATDRVDAISMNIDLLPTIAALIDVSPAAAEIDGKDLTPVMRGSQKSPHDALLYFNNEDIIGIRTQDWKFLTHAYYRKSVGAFEKFDQLDGFDGAYDLLFPAGDDGGEQYSYADRHPDVVKALKRELEAARKQYNALRTRTPDPTFPN